MKKSIIAFLGILVFIVSCVKKEQEVPVSSVTLNRTTAELLIGEAVQLSASVSPADATQKTISWTSSNSSVATVSGTGMVSAIAEGQSTITASAGGKTAICSITVKKKTVEVTAVELNKSEIALTVGGSETLTATVKPDDATDKSVTWATSDATIATVENGKVVAIEKGTATITARAGEKSATCTVIVISDAVVDLGTGILWAVKDLGAENEYDQGSFYAWGEVEGNKPDYTWETYRFGKSYDSLVKYYHDRKFILDDEDDAANIILGSGWHIPSVKDWDRLLNECDWVEETINGTPGRRAIGKNGNSVFFPYCGGASGTSILPSTTSALYWSNELSSNAYISEYGRIWNSILNLAAGMKIRPVKDMKVDSFSMDCHDLTIKLDSKAEIPISASQSPLSATSLRWSSDNEDVAIVSCGIVLGVGVGKTIIRATSPEGTCSDACTITVNEWTYPEAEGISLGTGLEWASWNLGATSPEELGDYFAWGDITHKSCFDKSTYQLYDDEGHIRSYSESSGTLLEEYDVATKLWSNGWRLPTREEVQLMIDYCSIVSGEMNGVDGYYITGRNGNSIFIPYVNYKEGYWTPSIQSGIQTGPNTYSSWWSNLWTSSISFSEAYSTFVPEAVTFIPDTPPYVYNYLEYKGLNVRPVRSVWARDYELYIHRLRLETGESFSGLGPVLDIISYESRDESIASVDERGYVTAHQDGETWIIASTERGGAKDSCLVVVKPWEYPVAEAVDLGLSVKWASWNVGATNEGETGDYFSFGQAEHHYKNYYQYPQDLFDLYLMGKSSELKEDHDVAHVQWGEGWRLPSKEEYEELLDKCTQEPGIVNNVPGTYFIGPNNNRIFFPILGIRAEERNSNFTSAMYLSRSLFCYGDYSRPYTLTLWSTGYRLNYEDGFFKYGLGARPIYNRD